MSSSMGAVGGAVGGGAVGGGGAFSETKVKKTVLQAINLLYEFLKTKERVLIWLYENTGTKIEGIIVGFDEFMNVVLEDASEINKNGDQRRIGKILLKGDCISLVQKARYE